MQKCKTNETPAAQEERRQVFEALIGGEFKDLYQEKLRQAGAGETFRALEELRREVEQLKQDGIRREGRRRAEEQLAAWAGEARKVKELYPSFDFKAETGNRDFMGLLRAGIGVQTAYEIVHMEEIKAAAARAAAQSAGEQMKSRLQTKSARPAENGTSTQGAVVVKSDVHNLTRADRADIAKRVQRGEKIEF